MNIVIMLGDDEYCQNMTLCIRVPHLFSFRITPHLHFHYKL